MGTSRRARQTAEQWAVIVEEYLTSGLSETEFCENRDLCVGTLRKWRYRQPSQSRKQFPQTRKKHFLPVAVNQPNISPIAGSVSIELSSDIKINCAGLSLESIAQLALAVRHGR